MEPVRVKTLHLTYPERLGRRRVKLETLSGDDPSAVYDLLRAHGGSEVELQQLLVVYAELEIRLRVPGGVKHHVIRLWPNRSNLNQGTLGIRLRACLKRWNIADEG